MSMQKYLVKSIPSLNHTGSNLLCLGNSSLHNIIFQAFEGQLPNCVQKGTGNLERDRRHQDYHLKITVRVNTSARSCKR